VDITFVVNHLAAVRLWTSSACGIARSLRLTAASIIFDEHARRDRLRDERFERDGFKVLRFWNNDIDRNIAGVLTTIDMTLQQSTPPVGPSDRHPPPAGEG
jgi:hypothetical protein